MINFVAQGTLIHGSEYLQRLKIITWYNRYLFNLNVEQDIDYQTFKFYRDIMFINPKYFQHIMSALYPNAHYSLATLKKLYPKISIDSVKPLLHITEDIVVTTTATTVMQNFPSFSKGCLPVLACENNPNEKPSAMQGKALMQTNQKHPDFIYNVVYKLNDKENLVWERFYDWKTGKIEINAGHILCFSKMEDYEYNVRHLLYGQYEKYKHILTIKNELNVLLLNKTLTWAERNTRFQQFVCTILHKHPDINPSFMLYNPLLYKTDNQTIPSTLKGLIIASSFESLENTQRVITKAIILGGKTCQKNYIKHFYKSPIIVDFIKEFLADYI